jgi:superfamily I DNA/RNA helicase
MQTKLQRLLTGEPRLGERIEVASINSIGLRLHKAHLGPVKLADDETVKSIIANAAAKVTGHNFTTRFLANEWQHVVDTWQLKSWESYRDVTRLGRRTRLNEAKRQLLWKIFEAVIAELSSRSLKTYAAVYTDVSEKLKEAQHPAFEFAVIDEAQDIDVGQLKMMAVIGGNRPNALFFAGDTGQRIFQQPFSWKSLGVDVRGRSKTLRVNYRTSHQIRTHADRLLETEITDADGTTENRKDTVSVFNGVPPEIVIADTEQKETVAVSKWLAELVRSGLLPHECGVFVRSAVELPRAQSAVKAAGIAFKVLDENVDTHSGKLSICTMHLAKGLEFRAVVVMACDDEVLPLQERIEEVGDAGDLQEVYDTERHLLYVACTRARDRLMVSAVTPGSEFLGDFHQK